MRSSHETSAVEITQVIINITVYIFLFVCLQKYCITLTILYDVAKPRYRAASFCNSATPQNILMHQHLFHQHFSAVMF